jgi:N,N'-diacetyllegionaminate synthase
MLKSLELSEIFHKELIACCKEKEIEFISTPFDNDSVELLDGLGVGRFKIPSGEITNKPLIRNVSEKGKPIILSTGMSFIGEVERAVRWIEETWNKLNGKPKLTLLHCVSNYPTNVEDCNLMAMKTMETAFGYPVGFSDHTLGIEVSAAAVALGATVIEKHFTVDKNMTGPDHKASLEPDELKAMIVSIRNVEKAIGDGYKTPKSCEENVRNIARKSLVAKRNIKRGDVFAIDNIAIKRPGSGISPIEIENVIGRKADRDFFVDELIVI